MIKVQDWVASIPDEEKHVAYAGEGSSEQREFLLCGKGWETYKEWGFHLDMAFDPVSITTHDSRQVVQTTVNSTERVEETSVSLDEVTTKETYSVDNVQVGANPLTDVAPLAKTVADDGIHLTWTILRQHTVLPGKLWATIRAVGSNPQQIKKSAIITFEVDSSIAATPAAMPPISEVEQMLTRMDDLRGQTEDAADRALRSSTTSTMAADAALNSMHQALEAVQAAQEAAQTTTDLAAETKNHHLLASDAATTAAAASAHAQESMQTAATHAASAALAVQGAQMHSTTALEAVNQCSRYTQRCATAAEEAAKAVENLNYNRVNVRDCGAVGDGIADDRAAIVSAFNKAKTMLPCEVYFPAGTYGISNGITVELAYGTGGLRVCGAGWDVSTIKYLESYNPYQASNQWYAIRIWPVGRPNTKPANEDEYLHDISITGLSVYDTDPIAHAWNTAKGDPNKEETHGFDIQFCKRVSVTDCKIDNVGDEGIDIFCCHDVVVKGNHLLRSPGAGSSGGAISIGDGCKGVVVSGNIVNGSAPDEVLEDGTVIEKRNFGIAVESLLVPVRDVVIAGNVVHNIQGNGINLGATNAGSGLYNINIKDNIMQGCNNGIGDAGLFPKEGVSISNNTISDCTKLRDNSGHGITFRAKGLVHASICGNTIRNTDVCGMYVDGVDTLIDGNFFDNIGAEALYVVDSATIRNCFIKNTGVVTSTGGGAIYCYTGAVCTVSGCRLLGVRQTKGISNAIEIEGTTIEMVDAGGNPVTNANAVSGNGLKRLVNCQMDGYTTISVDKAVVQGNTITNANGWANAITINANGAIVSGNNITQTDKSKGKKAIAEGTGKNHNLFIGNVCNTAITTVGAQSVAVNNIDTSIAA